MFRFQDNLPEVYINESRDFQLLARLSDVLFSGLKYDIDSMVNILDAMLAKDRMLELMCTKIGFFPKIEIDSQVLKYIISSFPYIIKNKGNKKSIEYAINAILKAENSQKIIEKPLIDIINKIDQEYLGRDPYTIYIYTNVKIYNKKALKELLRYVLPSGYSYKIGEYSKIGQGNLDILSQKDKINIININKKYNAQLRLPNTDLTINYDSNDSLTPNQKYRLGNLADAYINAYNTIEIVTPNTGTGLEDEDSNNIKFIKSINEDN